MSAIKLIISDVDGTLLNRQAQISAANISAVQAAIAAGVQVVLASARVRVSMAPFAEQIGTNAPMVCCDGAQVYHTPDGLLWHQWIVPHDIAAEITSLSDQNGFELVTTAGEATCYLQKDDQPLGEYEPGRVRVQTNRAALDHGEVARMVVYDSVGMDLLYQHCQQYGDQIRLHLFAHPGEPPHSLAIFPPSADKGHALRFLMQQLELEPEQVIAIGDNFNDMPMLQVAGVSVAMGNAPDEIKDQVDYVAPDHNHDGLAWAFNELLG